MSECAGKTDFVLFGIQRTGTTWLYTLLDNHPSIVCFGEAFQDVDTPCHPTLGTKRYKSYINMSVRRRVLDFVNRKYMISTYLRHMVSALEYEAKGFKFMLDQANKYPEFLKIMQQNKFKIIHVWRSNILKILVSRVRAELTGIYVTQNTVDSSKIHLDDDLLIANLENIKAAQSELLEIIQGLLLDYISIQYEDLLTNRETELGKILEFLEVDNTFNLTTYLTKINPDELIDVIANYGEIAEILRGTENEAYLE
jgi:LPS sulfotransferase NodH